MLFCCETCAMCNGYEANHLPFHQTPKIVKGCISKCSFSMNSGIRICKVPETVDSAMKKFAFRCPKNQ